MPFSGSSDEYVANQGVGHVKMGSRSKMSKSHSRVKKQLDVSGGVIEESHIRKGGSKTSADIKAKGVRVLDKDVKPATEVSSLDGGSKKVPDARSMKGVNDKPQMARFSGKNGNGNKKTNGWFDCLRKYRADHPDATFKDAMRECSKHYKK